MTTDDVSRTTELSGGGGGSVGPLQGLDGVGRGNHGWGWGAGVLLQNTIKYSDNVLCLLNLSQIYN